ncbi:MAG: 4-(cytidine 5'-diphospho)-2-C-methyl-D-erythritol kinase [Ignavibacteriaceae bacterium]|nr:4-(cytidine 5'-diphospho)-2-C-methyl-D-erythritol kinase [bacterium BMS3Abin03]
MDKLILYSPAKINIGLNIIRKRNDGYHDLETIFYPLLLSDVLTFNKANKTMLTSNSEEINNLGSNLVTDAITLLQEHTKKELRVEIHLEKNIPVGGGLGGGSSNAAVTLKAINQLYNLRLNYKILSELALKLGSDVPYFLDPEPYFASSRGEVLSKINLLLGHPILIVNPGIHISTKWAFENLKIKTNTKKLSDVMLKKSISIDDIKSLAKNDFEEIVFKEYPDIKSIKDRLNNLDAEFSLMTGSGSTVFGIFTNLQKARRAKTEFQKDYFTYLNFPVDQGSIT